MKNKKWLDKTTRDNKGRFIKGTIALNKGRHIRRPKGLKYKVVKENKTWFKKGVKTWNTGTKGIMKPNSTSFKKGSRVSPKTEFKKGQTTGSKNVNWKGGISIRLKNIQN